MNTMELQITLGHLDQAAPENEVQGIFVCFLECDSFGGVSGKSEIRRGETSVVWSIRPFAPNVALLTRALDDDRVLVVSPSEPMLDLYLQGVAPPDAALRDPIPWPEIGVGATSHTYEKRTGEELKHWLLQRKNPDFVPEQPSPTSLSLSPPSQKDDAPSPVTQIDVNRRKRQRDIVVVINSESDDGDNNARLPAGDMKRVVAGGTPGNRLDDSLSDSEDDQLLMDGETMNDEGGRGSQQDEDQGSDEGVLPPSVPKIFDRCPPTASDSESDEEEGDEEEEDADRKARHRARRIRRKEMLHKRRYFRYFHELLLIEEADGREKECYTWPERVPTLELEEMHENNTRHDGTRRFRATIQLPQPPGEVDRLKRGHQLAFISQAFVEKHGVDEPWVKNNPPPGVFEVSVSDVMGHRNQVRVSVVVILRPRDLLCHDFRLNSSDNSEDEDDEDWNSPISPKVKKKEILSRALTVNEDDDAVTLTDFVVTRSYNDSTADAIREAMDQLTMNRSLNLSKYILCNKTFSENGKHNQFTVPSTIFSLFESKVTKAVKLNPSQRHAAQVALCGPDPVTLIQGPPGTGKTMTSAAIILMAVLAGHRVIACGHSNAAVDNLCRKVLELRDAAKLSFTVFRHESSSRARFQEGSDLPTVPKEVDRILAEQELKNRGRARGPPKRFGIEIGVMKSAQVLCCTCNGSGARSIRIAADEGEGWPIVLMDEASQVVEPVALIPLLAGMQRLVMVGDPKQLGSVIKSSAHRNSTTPSPLPSDSKTPSPLPSGANNEREIGLELSLFERLCVEEVRPMQLLNVQYRMHPALVTFSNRRYYEGKLESGVTASERIPTGAIPWNWGSCIYFFDMSTEFPGNQEKQSEGGRYVNSEEARQVAQMVKRLMQDGGVAQHAIGVMTPYDEQRNELRRLLHSTAGGTDSSWVAPNVEVDSIDAFQGREKDYIVFSTVRTRSAGFLDDERRMNVAITRAKRGLIVLGDKDFFRNRTQSGSVWRSFVSMLSGDEEPEPGRQRPPLPEAAEVEPFVYGTEFIRGIRNQMRDQEIANDEVRELATSVWDRVPGAERAAQRSSCLESRGLNR